MKRPTSTYTDEFRNWSYKRFFVLKYAHEILDIPDFGTRGGEKKYWDEQKKDHEHAQFYGDRLLANAILDAMPAEADAVEYCEQIFGQEANFEEKVVSAGNKKKEDDSPTDVFKQLLDNMSGEQKEEIQKTIDAN